MQIEVIGDKRGLFTLVGVQYYTDEVEIGTKVVLKVINGTTFGIDENNKEIGVFPQKDSKCEETYELGLPVTRNSDIKESEELLAQQYTVVGFIIQNKNNKVSKYCVLTLNANEVVEATTEADKEEDKMEINEILKGDEMLQHKVERRNELINKANDLKRSLATIESGIEVLESEISEIVEKHTLINQIKANLEVLDIDELRKVSNAIIDNSSSSDEEQ